jgi:hypothetical protein
MAYAASVARRQRLRGNQHSGGRVMLESYFVITSSEDGVAISTFKSKDKLLDFLRGEEDSCCEPPHCLKELPADWMDCNEIGENDCVIIKGHIVLPKPKSVIKTWEVE